jgi:hypothetical protein
VPTRTITQEFRVGGVLTNATSVKLSDPDDVYGIKRNDTDAVVVANNTAMTNPSTGVYTYTFTAVVNVSYTAYIEFSYGGDTIFREVTIPAIIDSFGMVCSYDSLVERVGHELFGIRSGFSIDQLTDILQCIRDGLGYVYDAHNWSFFRPIKDITTTAPYTTGTVTIVSGVVTLSGGTWPSWAVQGIIQVSNNYYSIASRDSDTQLTLNDTSVAVAAGTSFQLGRPEVALDDSFEAIANDSHLTYYPGQNLLYPPVRQRHDQYIRTIQQTNPYFWRPFYYSVRTVEFDPTVGSRKRLAFYPIPDAAYVLRVPMILRPTMIDSTNQYPVGGETLAQLIIEACLSAVEIDFYEKNPSTTQSGRHTQMFQAMLPLAIKADQEKSAPTSLGPDRPRGEGYHYGYPAVYDSDYARSALVGSIVLDGDTL